MNNINKILCLIFSTLMFCSITGSSYGDISEADSGYINVVTNLKLFEGLDDGLFHPDDTFTRAEFAAVISRIFRLESANGDTDWILSFFGREEDEISLKSPDKDKTQRFSDVEPNHWGASAIEAAVSYGFMKGTSADTFEPDRSITYQEAVKTMISALGYEIRAIMDGGYPYGYMLWGSNLKITAGISRIGSADMDRKTAARLVYNCLDVDMLQGIGYGATARYETVKGENLLKKAMNIDKIKGIMTENDVTSYTRPKSSKRNEAVINGLSLYVSPKLSGIRDFIGHFVEGYYYINDEQNRNELLFAVSSAQDDYVRINGDDFISYSAGTIKYYNAAGNEASIKAPVGAPMIFNGLAQNSYSDKEFTMRDGYIDILRNDNTFLIVIKNYQTVYVSAVDKSDFKLYNKLADGTNIIDNSFELPDTDGNIIWSLKTSDGKNADFSALTAGQGLSVAKNETPTLTAIEIIISNDTVTGVFEGSSSDEYNKPYITIDGEDYYYSEAWGKSNKKEIPNLGEEVEATLDAFGKIAWISGTDKRLKSAVIMKAGQSVTGFSANKLKIFDSNGDIKIIELADRLTFEDQYGNRQSLLGAAQINITSGLSGYIKYGLNKDGKINILELPLLKEETGRTRTYTLFEMNSNFRSNITYKSSMFTFGGKAYVSEETVVFGIPTDLDNDKGYEILSRNYFQNDQFYNITAYASELGTSVAEAIVARNSSGNNYGSSSDKFAVVEKRSVVTDEDGEILTKLSIYEGGQKKQLYATEENINAVDSASTPHKIGSYKIDVGDIIWYSVNSMGRLSDVRLIYSPRISNPSGGKGGYLADTDYKYYIADELVDRAADKTKLYEVEDAGSVLNTGNPYAVSGGNVNSMGHRFSQYEYRIMLGYALSRSGGYIKVTTQDVNQEGFNLSGIPSSVDPTDPAGYTGVYVTDAYDTSRFNMIYVDYKGNGVTVSEGKLDNIRCYNDTGEGMKILTLLQSGEPRQFIVINE